jgi:hypothetical protein
MIRFRLGFNRVVTDDAWMQSSFAWICICICIMEGGHFSIPDADADPRMTGLALILDQG